MSPVDILPTLCEIAITIAGFTAIVVSIRAQRAGSWNVEERIRVLGILAVCGFVAVCAILPFAISGLSESKHLHWAIPLVMSGTVCIAIFLLVARATLKKEFEFLIPSLTWTMMGLLIVLSTISILSGFGLFAPYSAGLLVLQLLGMLVACSISIVVTLALTYRRVATGERAEHLDDIRE